MKLHHARAIAKHLLDACAAAEARGEDTIDLAAQLRDIDDAARADLEAAIAEKSAT